VRIETPKGPIHVFRPPGAGSRAAVVYVHGYYDTADSAVAKHQLEQQFTASGRDATFIVPEAPLGNEDAVKFPDLAELLRLAGAAGAAPVVVIAHSGGYRTVLPWLASPAVRHVILLDALYGGSEAFKAWGQRGTNTMDLVGYDTADASRQLADALGQPYHQATGHMSIVTDGLWIPKTLRAAPLAGIGGVFMTALLVGFVAWGAWRLLR